jgi:hypothetical protein
MLSVGHAVTCRHPPWGMPATAQRAGCGTAAAQAVQVRCSMDVCTVHSAGGQHTAMDDCHARAFELMTQPRH